MKEENDISSSSRPTAKANMIRFPRRNILMGKLAESRPSLLKGFSGKFNYDTTNIIVLHGLGGVGKTEFVKEYAYEHQDSYSQIAWVNAESEDTIIESLKVIAQELQLKIADFKLLPLVSELAKYLKKHFLHPEKGLIIFDNAVNPQLIEDILSNWNCDIIITTRNPNWNPELMNV